MLYLQTALFYEGKPYIDKYRLRKIQAHGGFQLFEGDNARLIVSGPGPVNAAAAAAHMLTRYSAGLTDMFVNIGSAGSAVFTIGDIILCHKIVNTFTGKALYPDMMYKHPFQEGTLSSVGAEGQLSGYDLIDMEGAFACGAAQSFLPSAQIHCVKVISDNLQPGAVTPDELLKLMSDTSVAISGWLDELPGSDRPACPFTDEEGRLMELVGGQLHMSFAMIKRLQKLCGQAKARGLDLIEILSEYSDIITQKNEGKKVFTELTARLCEGS